MRSVRKRTTGVVAAGLSAMIMLAGCTDEQPAAQQKEADRQQAGYSKLAADQPAKTMRYSPTRETINYWIDTWDEPEKLAYVYLQASNGQLVGYYIFKGLPVSYCASLTPTVGTGISALIYEQPLPRQDVEPLGFAKIKNQ